MSREDINIHYSREQWFEIYKDNIKWAEEQLKEATSLMDRIAWTFYINAHKKGLRRLQPPVRKESKSSQSPIAKIKEEADIVTVINRYTTLKGRNGKYHGCCPLHEDRIPSLSVDTEKQLWHCFGCGKGGDIIDFVKLAENIDTNKAITILLGNV